MIIYCYAPRIDLVEGELHSCWISNIAKPTMKLFGVRAMVRAKTARSLWGTAEFRGVDVLWGKLHGTLDY